MLNLMVRMDRLEEMTSEKSSEFAGINLVISIAFRRDKFVARRLVDNKFVHLLVEVAIQPAGQIQKKTLNIDKKGLANHEFKGKRQYAAAA